MNGSDLKARRKTLGWDLEAAVRAMNRVWGRSTIFRMDIAVCEQDPEGMVPGFAETYESLLTAEEDRRATAEPEALAEPASKVGDWEWVRNRAGTGWCADQRERVAPPTPAEPVPPEGVTALADGVLCTNGGHQWALTIKPDGSFLNGAITLEALEYVAALSRYRAAKHEAAAEREKQAKLDAVKAAEEAHAAAMRNEEACVMARENAKRLADESYRALQAARKEAGERTRQ